MLQENFSTTAKTQAHERRQFRLVSCLAFLLSLVLLSSLAAWSILRFSMPESPLRQVGILDDFGNGQKPQLFWKDNTPFYVVRSGDKVISLSPYSRRGGYRCMIQWNPERQQFVDPCWGSRMDINGKYSGGGPPWDMPQLPVHIIDGEVWVEVK